MKKFIAVSVLLFLVGFSAEAQFFQFTRVTENGQSLNAVPRFSWRLPLNSTLFELGKDASMFGGMLLKNEGFIYDRNGSRFKHRTISFGPNIGFFIPIKNNLKFVTAYGVDLNLHYKEKEFVGERRRNKEIRVSEWGSDRVGLFNHFVQGGFTLSDNIYVFGEYYFNDFFNADFTETVNGTSVQPYQSIEVSRFNLGVTVLILDSWW